MIDFVRGGWAGKIKPTALPFPAPALRRLKFSASDRFFKNDVRGEHRDGECEFVPRI
jgi:hypothetical protein